MQNPYVAHDTRYAIRNHGTAKKCILTFQNKNVKCKIRMLRMIRMIRDTRYAIMALRKSAF